MANRDQFTTEIYVNQEQAQDALVKLEAEVRKTAKAYEKLLNTKDADQVKTEQARKAWEQAVSTLKGAERGVEEYGKALNNLSGQNMNTLLRMQRQIRSEMNKTKPNTEEWNKLAEQYAKVTNRMKDLKKSQDEISNQSKGLKGVFDKVAAAGNKFGMAVMAIPNLVKPIAAALSGVVKVTKEVINASQTTGDAWRNAMTTMKTTTDAFFMALSTGDWSAFQNGLSEALKKARELAELKDLLGSFQIAGGYMQAKYRTDYTTQLMEATNTENDAATRRAALDQAKADLDAQREFTEREAKATFDALQTMFDAWKGITFDSQAEFDSFFDRLFRYTTTGADDAVNEIKRLKAEVDAAVQTAASYGQSGFVPQNVIEHLEQAQAAYAAAMQSASKETLALVQAADLNDEKHKELIQTYAAYRADIQRIDQDEKSFNRTRDRVIKQIGKEEETIESVIADIDAWVEQEKRAALERYNANKASFDSIADAYREYQNELTTIEQDGEAQREAARKRFEEEQREAAEKARKKREAENDKAYQAAIKRLENHETAQKNIWKQQYAAGLIDKQTYEARIASVEEDFLKQKMATAQRYGKDTDQFMSQLLDRQIARLEFAKALLKDEMEAWTQAYKEEHPDENPSDETMQRVNNQLRRQGYREVLGTIPGESDEEFDERIKAYEDFQEQLFKKASDIRAAITEDSARKAFETEMRWADKLAEQGILTTEEAEKRKLKLKLEYAERAAEQLNTLAEYSSSFITALQDAELARLEANYQADLTAAGDNAEKKAEVEANYEEEKLEIQKKYADWEMGVNIAKTIAAGALAAIQAFAQLGPVAGAIAAALIAATTAAEVYTIVQQRNAIKNSSVSSSGSGSASVSQRTMTGYAEGGYTEGHTTITTVGEKGVEYVIPHWMVRKHPVMVANLERYRKAGSHGRSGSVAEGFAEGGYTGKTQSPTGTSQADILSAVREGAYQGIIDAAEGGYIHAWVSLNELEDKINQKNRFKSQTSRS